MSTFATTMDGSPLSVATWDPVPTLGGALTSLRELALISLFSWGRAETDDRLPVEGESRRGWWGDSTREDDDTFGSRLWLLGRSVLTAQTLVQAEDLAREALQWMVDDGLASRVEASADAVGRGRVELTVTIYRSSGESPVELRFGDLWASLRA